MYVKLSGRELAFVNLSFFDRSMGDDVATVVCVSAICQRGMM